MKGSFMLFGIVTFFGIAGLLVSENVGYAAAFALGVGVGLFMMSALSYRFSFFIKRIGAGELMTIDEAVHDLRILEVTREQFERVVDRENWWSARRPCDKRRVVMRSDVEAFAGRLRDELGEAEAA